jgi:PAS domain S-box-containing protein
MQQLQGFWRRLWDNPWMSSVPDYEALFQASPYPYLLLDPGLTIVAANRACLQVNKASHDDLVGRALFDAFPANPDDPDSTSVAEVRASIARAVKTGRPDSVTFVRYAIRPANGEEARFQERYWSLVHSPVFNGAGELTLIAQNALDVTGFYQFDRSSGSAEPQPGPALESGEDGAGQARRHAAMQRAVMGERNYMRKLFNQAPGFVAVLNGPQHVFEMVNEAYYQLVGHRPIIGQPVLAALPELDGQGYQQLLDGVYQTGTPFVGRGMKAQLQRKPDGPLVDAYVDLLYQPLFGEDGAVNGIFVQGHDVTEANAAQLAKRESEERLAEAMVAAGMVAWDWFVDTREVILSENALNVLGLHARTMDEMHAPIPEQDRARLVGAHARALASHGSYHETIRYVRPDDGRTVWIEVRGRVRLDASGRVVSVRGAAIDVTERRRAEEELRDAHRRKDEFLAMLAHELRNPLAPIDAAAQLLRRDLHDDARAGQPIEIITRQVRHMAGMLDDLIDVSRVTRGLITIERAPCDMRAVLADALEQVRPVADSRGQSLESLVAPGPLHIFGDHKRVVQVLANLLGNASRYTPAGGRIVLELAAHEAQVVLRVRDNGIGIAAALLPHVFDLFTQGERSADRAEGGLGVGLAVVRSLVEQHGGQVSAASDGPGQGSVFTVVLPQLVCGAIGQPDGLGAPLAPQRALQVLVVDDNADAADMLALLLETEGYEVGVAHRSATALARVAAAPPQVCLLDIGLPDMDGYDLAARLRAMPSMQAARLVAITGYGQQADRARSLAAGFDHHLVKPVQLGELFALLRSFAHP